ncbi:glycosyltransferase family 25 protein [Rhodobacteraceae bacterium XHP0102]|nr:glycosyltransferase family 25 protein [Rhodobacteraceae bacterium XHP0102]
MKVLIINMATATDRMAFMAAQMDHFGLDWARIEAVTPETLTPRADDPVWHRWQRPLRVTEMALCASHMAAWRAVIAADAPHLILEDDAVLAADLPAFLALVAELRDVDHISLETRGRKKVLGRVLHPAAPMLRLWQDRTGSAAYIAYPKGAQLMLDHAQRAGGPSDAIISSTYAMHSYQAVPALAVQLDICAQYGVPQAIKTKSLIDAVDKPRLPAHGMAALGFRARRIWGQVVMGWRQLRHRGSRVHVAPARDWPEISL